jgi:hypothetical protein
MAQVRLYVDEDASEAAVVIGLRARGIDVFTTAEAGRLSHSDEDQLEFAGAQGRTLYTFNARDFSRLHGEFLHSGRSHAGIVVISDQQHSIGEKIRRIAHVAQTYSAESLVDQIVYL